MRLLVWLLSPLVDPAVRVRLRVLAHQNEQLRHERDMARHQATRLLGASRHLAADNTRVRGRLIDLEPTVVIQSPYAKR